MATSSSESAILQLVDNVLIHRAPLLLQEKQQHDHRRFRLNAVLQIGRHVNPRPRLGLDRFFAERQCRLTMDEVQNGWHRGRVLGQFFPLTEAKDHRLHVIVIEQSASEDAVVGRLDLFGEIDELGVALVHDSVPLGVIRSTPRF